MLGRQQQIIATAEAENRDLTDAEVQRADSVLAEVEAVRRKLAAAEVEAVRRKLAAADAEVASFTPQPRKVRDGNFGLSPSGGSSPARVPPGGTLSQRLFASGRGHPTVIGQLVGMQHIFLSGATPVGGQLIPPTAK
jgi:hypothetical protein